MDEPTDPLARQLALSAFDHRAAQPPDRPHWHHRRSQRPLQLYVGALPSTVIAIAFVGQASELGDAFHLFALALLPPVFPLGVFSYLRLVQTSIEDMVYAVGTFRIRQYFQSLDAAAVPFFPHRPRIFRSSRCCAWAGARLRSSNRFTARGPVAGAAGFPQTTSVAPFTR
jgi:hypothetical protein